MKDIKIAICDDCIEDIKDLCEKLERYGETRKCKVVIKSFCRGAEFIEKFQPIYDVIFLDIRIPDIAGDVLADKIRNVDRQIPVVFISSYLDAVFKGYKLNIQTYIRKPASYRIIEREMDEALEKQASMQGSFFLDELWRNTYKIYYSKLAYVETNGRGSLLHYNGDAVVSGKRIGEYEKILESNGFYRCHNSYIVNLRFIEQIQSIYNRYELVLLTGERIPMSRGNKKECIKRMLETLR